MRELKVYGTSNSARYLIRVNENISQPSDSVLYSYTTEPEFHGAYDIRIQIFEGSITLEKCLVTYPAIINNSSGTITFEQPIKSPLYKVVDSTIIPQSFPIKIYRGTFKFKQLMFNGPNHFIVNVDESVDYSSGLYIGNLLTRQYIPELRTIAPVYKYRQRDNDIWSEGDLIKLENEVNYGNNVSNSKIGNDPDQQG